MSKSGTRNTRGGILNIDEPANKQFPLALFRLGFRPFFSAPACSACYHSYFGERYSVVKYH
ncbi:hypothetical protein ACWAU3_15535 [Shewanella sp. JL219SE-S6]